MNRKHRSIQIVAVFILCFKLINFTSQILFPFDSWQTCFKSYRRIWRWAKFSVNGPHWRMRSFLLLASLKCWSSGQKTKQNNPNFMCNAVSEPSEHRESVATLSLSHPCWQKAPYHFISQCGNIYLLANAGFYVGFYSPTLITTYFL